MKKKFEKNAHSHQSTSMHAKARQFTPEHANSHQSTSMQARARQCTPEHAKHLNF